MSGTAKAGMASEGGEGCLSIALAPVASFVRAGDGRDIPFTRAVLTIANSCASQVADLVVHASLGQEGGTVQDVSRVFAWPAAASMPPGREVNWDVYDLLLPAHAGTASKVHMFGYRAALKWRFDLAVWAEYRSLDADPSGLKRTPVARWAFWWRVPDQVSGSVTLTIEEVKE